MLRGGQQYIFDQIAGDGGGNSFIIIGEGQVGKSFLLNELADYFKKRGKKVIFIKLERFAGTPFKEGLLPFLARELEIENSFDAVSSFLEKSAGKILIIMDEVNQLDPERGGFFRSFAGGESGVRYIVTARDKSALNDSGPCSAFVNIMRPLFLDRLDRDIKK